MENKKFYVYVLMDSSIKMEWEYNGKKYYYKPFYIGMGSGYRINYHGNKKDLESVRNDFKKNYILKMMKYGFKIIREKLIEKLSSKEACEKEIQLIKKFGRVSVKSGILTNLSTGGEKYTYGADNPISKTVYQYSKEGIFINQHECIADIKIDGYKTVNTGISSCTIRNSKNFPNKISTSYGFIWLAEYKGESIKEILNKNDNRIYRYSENFELLNIYESGKDAEKDGFSDSSIYHCIANKKLYKNSYWSKGIIKEIDSYRKDYNNCKKVYQYSSCGNFIKEHECVKNIPFNEDLNISSYTITDACRLNNEKYPHKVYTAGGYIWMYDYKGQYVKTVEDLQKIKIYQLDENTNLKKIYKGYTSFEDTEYNEQGVRKAIANKKMYKNHFWTLDSEINPEDYIKGFKTYYQILPNGELFKTYNKRSEIPEEFNKENVGSACNKGNKYKGYYWKNKL